MPILQHYSGSWFGPFDVPWLHLVGIAAFGLLSAFLASAVPALIASRQDVVAVLAGRRGDRRPSLRSPLRRADPAGRGHRRGGVRREGVDQRRVLHRRRGHRGRARHDPARPGRARAGLAALVAAAAHAAVRRAGRRPAPLADRAGGGGRGGDRRGCGGPRDRHVQRRAAERGDLHPDADVRRRRGDRVGGLVGVPVGRRAGGPGGLGRGAPRDPVPRGWLPQRARRRARAGAAGQLRLGVRVGPARLRRRPAGRDARRERGGP